MFWTAPSKAAAAGDYRGVMQPMASATVRPRRRPAQPRGRDFTVVARAERDGREQCSAALVVVKSSPGLLGMEPTDALTVWFYGTMRTTFSIELEELAEAARRGEPMPELRPIDLILLADGGELRLEGCRLGWPTRVAGPASTLEYRVSHPGRAAKSAPVAQAA
jgi:hypothetical protein